MAYIAGLVVIVVLRELVVSRLLSRSAKLPDHPPELLALVDRDRAGGRIIGYLETVLIYTAFGFAGDDRGLIVAGYLAFKVASKWEVWSHVYRIPDKIEAVSETDYLMFRTKWGHYLFTRFVVGTLLSLLIAFVAVVVQEIAPRLI